MTIKLLYMYIYVYYFSSDTTDDVFGAKYLSIK